MRRSFRVLSVVLVGFGLSAAMADATPITGYSQTNLVSDLPGIAAVQDPNLQNPWGVSESATSPLWISNQNAGVATLYTVTGLSATPAGGPLVVTVPTPTGQVNNSIGGVATTSFVTNQSGTSVAAHFIFASLNGNIYAWAAAPNPAALAATGPAGASYTGLAIGGTTAAPLLYAANNAAGTVDVFNGSFQLVARYSDPNLPANLVPFNVQNIGGTIYVTYAPAGHSAETTATVGAVAILNSNGTFTTFSTSSQLASPWGIALAPAGFGQFSGDLLIGNFAYGNLSPLGGEINAYDPTDGNFLATLDSNSAWQGLWALTFGNGGSGGSPDILYFTTGLNAETDGLFAALSVPEPSTIAILGVGLLSLCALRRRRPLRLRDEAAG
ncbi:MAG: TIGR03118 family protein [Stellaceae bacterium]